MIGGFKFVKFVAMHVHVHNGGFIAIFPLQRLPAVHSCKHLFLFR